jgi:hypothetical protein
MGNADGKAPVDESRRGATPPPSSHAVRSVNARIQAGAIWMEIVPSDQLPQDRPDETLRQRVTTWRRTVGTPRIISMGLIATAALTAFTLIGSPYRSVVTGPGTYPGTRPSPSCCTTDAVNPPPTSTTQPPNPSSPKHSAPPVSKIGAKQSGNPSTTATSSGSAQSQTTQVTAAVTSTPPASPSVTPTSSAGDSSTPTTTPSKETASPTGS